jgi:hypothetical protein
VLPPQHAGAAATETSLALMLPLLLPQVAFEQGHHSMWHHHDGNYIAFQHFFSIFSKDWAVRTEDPW